MPPRDQRAFNVAYYAANREREIERVRLRQRASISYLRELRQVACADCGGKFLPIQMDFDHRDPRFKSFRVSSAHASLKSRERLLEEVAKCDIVCANCHRRRTRAQHQTRLSKRCASTASKAASQRARSRHHADLLDRLRSRPCEDCGGSFAPCAMDFDHRDSKTKTTGVTRLINGSYTRLMAEVSKCDIVCANCHRLRTFKRRESKAA